jgi:transcriptional repressor NrdR
MRCPYCRENRDKVVDSRASGDAATIRRRRECLACGRRFTTYEKIEVHPIRVIKKDGRRVEFDRSKIMSGLIRACEKRPVSTETLERKSNRRCIRTMTRRSHRGRSDSW